MKSEKNNQKKAKQRNAACQSGSLSETGMQSISSVISWVRVSLKHSPFVQTPSKYLLSYNRKNIAMRNTLSCSFILQKYKFEHNM